MTSECQDCHTQLYRKQNISEFKSLYNGSKIILIEQHFKPTCSRIASTIHSAKKSKDMIRELGYVELLELCETIPKVKCSQCLLYWNQGIIFCTCGQFLVGRESRRKCNKLRLDAISIPDHVIKKGHSHGARHGKTEEQKEYHIAWNAWKRDAAKELTLKVNISKVFTTAFSETKSIVNHNSNLAGPSKSAKRWTNWQNKITRTISLQRNSRDTKDNGISP